MGILNLVKLINKYAPKAVKTIPLAELRGQIVYIDASIAIYQWCYMGYVRRVVNAAGEFINHIQGAFFRTVALLSAGIIPVFVFDGPPPPSKRAVLGKRKLAKTFEVPTEVFAEVKYLLKLMGVPVIQAPSEADSQLAACSRAIDGSFVATEDLDVLVFGAKQVIRGLTANSRNIK